MPNFGVISNNRIINVIVADTKEIAESVSRNECILVDGTEIGVGAALKSETNEWINPFGFEEEEDEI